jgi:hypothetical protein
MKKFDLQKNRPIIVQKTNSFIQAPPNTQVEFKSMT